MRKLPLAALLLLATLGAPQALACQLVEPAPVLPRIFWQDAPEHAPDEVVVEVTPVRDAWMIDRTKTDVIIIACGPAHRVYRIVRVLTGTASEGQQILVPTGYRAADVDAILVGKLVTQEQIGWAAHLAADVDTTLLVLKPRLPAQ